MVGFATKDVKGNYAYYGASFGRYGFALASYIGQRSVLWLYCKDLKRDTAETVKPQ
jgi:hypothetical protein